MEAAVLGGAHHSCPTRRSADLNVGSSYSITQGTLALSSNYTLIVATGKTFAISPLAVTVTPDSNQHKTYGGTEPVLTYTVAPALIGSDQFTGALSRDTGENAGTSDSQQKK